MKRDSFIFYRSFMEALEGLSDKQYAKVFRAITKFAFNGEETALTGVENVIFLLIKPQLIANQKRYENGCRGGRPSVNQNETTTEPNNNQTITKTEPNENDNVNVNDKYLKEEVKEEKARTIKDIDINMKNFVEEYGIMQDGYNANLYGINFEKLSEAYKESSWLRENIKSMSKICQIYRKIESGYFKDYIDGDEEIIIPQEEWGNVERVLMEMKKNSENFNLSYEDYDSFREKQDNLYNTLTEDVRAYYVDYNGFIALYEYKSLENEKARFVRDFERFCKKRRLKNAKTKAV